MYDVNLYCIGILHRVVTILFFLSIQMSKKLLLYIVLLLNVVVHNHVKVLQMISTLYRYLIKSTCQLFLCFKSVIFIQCGYRILMIW